MHTGTRQMYLPDVSKILDTNRTFEFDALFNRGGRRGPQRKREENTNHTCALSTDQFRSRYRRGIFTAMKDINVISGEVVDAAIKVHTALGPGLLESAYEACLKHELSKRGLEVKAQVVLPVEYDGVRIELGYRLDLLVEGVVIAELKAVENVTDVHKAQILSYLKLMDARLGLLLNFNVTRMKDGIYRFANNL